MIISSRLIKSIRAARFKNKLILCGVISMLLFSCLFVMWMAIKPAASETVIVYEKPPQTVPIENSEISVIEPMNNPEDGAGNGE